MDLAHKKCKPCEGGVAPFDAAQMAPYLSVVTGWTVSADLKRLSKAYSFPDFKTALQFVNRIGALAEDEGHHPDLTLGWGKVGVELTTHAIKGLSENDFILAYKIDALPK